MESGVRRFFLEGNACTQSVWIPSHVLHSAAILTLHFHVCQGMSDRKCGRFLTSLCKQPSYVCFANKQPNYVCFAERRIVCASLPEVSVYCRTVTIREIGESEIGHY